MNKLILMTGTPGSGKSFLVSQLEKDLGTANWLDILSTDNLWETPNGQYLWHPDGLYHAHKLNQIKTKVAMGLGIEVLIIDNTNLTYKECMPYCYLAVENGYSVEIWEPKTEWANNPEECFKRNTHGVPLEAIERMLARKEPVDTMIEKLQTLITGLQITKGN